MLLESGGSAFGCTVLVSLKLRLSDFFGGGQGGIFLPNVGSRLAIALGRFVDAGGVGIISVQ